MEKKIIKKMKGSLETIGKMALIILIASILVFLLRILSIYISNNSFFTVEEINLGIIFSTLIYIINIYYLYRKLE